MSRVAEKLTLLRGKLGIENQVDHTQNAVHGRPDLVAHIGELKAFGAVGRLGLGFRFLQSFFAPAAEAPLGQHGGRFLGQDANLLRLIGRHGARVVDQQPALGAAFDGDGQSQIRASQRWRGIFDFHRSVFPIAGCRRSRDDRPDAGFYTLAIPHAAKAIVSDEIREQGLPQHLFGSLRIHAAQPHQRALEGDQRREPLLQVCVIHTRAASRLCSRASRACRYDWPMVSPRV